MTTQPHDSTATPKPKARNRIIEIDGMTGDACIAKVSKAINAVKGISLDAVKVGQARLRAATRDEADAVCAAIKQDAGFEARRMRKPVDPTVQLATEPTA